MIRALIRSTTGAAAIEFALTAPAFLLTALFIVEGGVAFQQWNGAKSAARTTARCLAIASPRCATGTQRVRDPGKAYALRVAAANGVPRLSAGMIDTDTISASNGLVYEQVVIRVPVEMFGKKITLTATERYPHIGG